MKRAIAAGIVALTLSGCGDGRRAAPARPAESSAPSAAVVTKATARLSVKTHHGVDSVSGLRIEGTCERGAVVVAVGHAPPYEPLRKVFDPQIDRIKPLRHAALRTRCTNGGFRIERKSAQIRLGAGPLMATPRAAGGKAVEVAIATMGIE